MMRWLWWLGLPLLAIALALLLASRPVAVEIALIEAGARIAQLLVNPSVYCSG